MHNPLHPKAIDVIETQKEILKEILDHKRQTGEIRSDAEYQAEWKAIMEKLGQEGTFATIHLQEGTTDAALFNETLEGLSYDIRAMFAQLNAIDETAIKHQRLNQSMMNHLKLRIKKLGDELTKQEELLHIQGSEELHYETFLDTNSFEQDHTYYTERNGQETALGYKVKWDPDQEAIKLPALISDNGLIGAGGIRLGKMEIRKQLGHPMTGLQNPFHDISRAIDTNPETFWSEQITMDTPIEVDMGEEYYGVTFGALVELEIKFDYLTPINELGFRAFGEYPFDIVGIQYLETDDELEVPKHLVHPNQSILEMKSRTLYGSTNFQFPDISAKRVRIILNQPHYVKNDFLASTKDERNLSLWLSSRTEEGPKKIDIQEFEVDRILELFEKEERYPVSKYEYQYGLYNLSVKRNEYQPVGIYVSQPIFLKGTVKTVRLESKEQHPSHLGDLRFTDIEHYVHDGVKWYPILPYNQAKVHSELMFPVLVQEKYQATLRFQVESGLIIRKNGIPITDSVILLPDGKTIWFAEYDASAYYTVEYIPTSEAWSIDFLKEYQDTSGTIKPNRLTEEFRGTDSKGRIRLSHYPFVDKEQINAQSNEYDPSHLENDYVPIRVRFIDSAGYHIDQPMNGKDKDLHISNVTNYFQSEESQLEAYDDEKTFYQYRVVGNEIQFNTSIPESTRVIVEYPYLVSHVRIKSILRRNMPGFHGLTPVLENYVARFQMLI